METFRELSPDEQKLALLQFMGQHLTGDLKELQKNLVSGNQTLRGMTIDPAQLVRSIPSGAQPIATVVNAGINVASQQPLNVQQPVQIAQETLVQNDPNQLEFDFNNSNYAKLIFDRLDAIDKKLDKILNTSKD